MNKHIIFNGLQQGSPIPFGLPFPKEGQAEEGYCLRQFTLLEKEAERLLQEQQTPISYQLFRLFWETGDRQEFEQVYFARRRRLLVFALLVWRQPEQKTFVHELEDCLWQICSEPMWSLPAHFMSPSEEELPLDKYQENLDLFACETGFAMVEALRMCGTVIAEKCRNYSELTVRKRILEPFLDTSTLYRFELMENNWSAVCAGAIGAVAILLLREEEMLTNLLHRVLSGIEVYLNSFGEDGVCVEGVDYFSYGFGFFTCFADYLWERTGGAIDYFASDRVKRIALGQQIFYLEEPYTLSFSDGSRKGRYRPGLTHYLKRRYEQLRIPDSGSAQDILEDSCGRFCLALRDILWYGEKEAEYLDEKTIRSSKTECGEKKKGNETISSRQSLWLADAQWFISYGNTMTLAAKGGNNAESHNHNDCGSFVLYKNGREMITDLGAGLYDRDYFTDQRYTYFAASARSHSIPVIDTKEQRAGKNAAAKRLKAELNAGKAGELDCFEAGLEDCYDIKGLTAFTRRIEHEKETGRVLVFDCFTASDSITVQERFVSLLPFYIQGQTASLEQDGVILTLSFESEMCLSSEEESYRDHEGRLRKAYLLLAEKKLQPGENRIMIKIQ